MDAEKVYQMSFGKIYPLLVGKAERKGRTREEVDQDHCLADRLWDGGD